jgi:hypothetical protein
VIQTLLDYYRIPDESLDSLVLSSNAPTDAIGYFQFGGKNTCFGRSSYGVATNVADSCEFDAMNDIRREGGAIYLPFDFSEVVENFRRERYRKKRFSGIGLLAESEPARRVYYFFREGLPISFRRHLQRAYFRGWKELPFPTWPVDFTVDNLHDELLGLLMRMNGVQKLPFIWFWPDGAPNCLIMTHDVETYEGRDSTFQLIDLDDSYGIKSSYQVVPEERYEVPDDYVAGIRSRGCEFNVHDLNHDGKLYQSRAEFERRAALINGYKRRYNAQGFRAGALYRNQDWFDLFEFSYDMSVPNVAHLEPMQGGCCTVMPYFIGKILELPLTASEDYSLFHILNDYSIDLWKQQLALLQARHGLMSFIAHPDYLLEPRARKTYESLLDYLQKMIARENIWAALPGDVDRWWRARSQMTLVPHGNEWEVVGPCSERAQVAYATLDGDRLVYEFADQTTRKSFVK